MPVSTINAIGFCAHYSDQGDWAFDYALRLARLHRVNLNVLHFLKDPYDPQDNLADLFSDEERAQLAFERERELRRYYDSRANDYLQVGFRLCEHTEWLELHRCLVARNFQVLVLGYLRPGARFGRRGLEEFAESFICPVVLVGPEGPNRFRLNSPARLIVDKLGVEAAQWEPVEALPV